MDETAAVVFIVDDDPSIRRAIKRLIGSIGLQVEQFGSAKEFLQAKEVDAPACLILDVRLPGMSGLDLQSQLLQAHIEIPIIFVTGYGDIPMSVRAMKAGAFEFFTKPFRDQDLLDAVQLALDRDRARRRRQREILILKQRFESLTIRERQVMSLVVSGLLNKQIATEIGTSETTAKVHRSQVMHKMGAYSLPELVRMATKLGITGSYPLMA
jgi:FixJ family two-component response regulator